MDVAGHIDELLQRFGIIENDGLENVGLFNLTTQFGTVRRRTCLVLQTKANCRTPLIKGSNPLCK